MKNKDYILRTIEYVVGGMNALIMVMPDDDENKGYKNLLDEWRDMICGIVEDIESEE